MPVVLQQMVVDYLDPPALDAVTDLVGVLSSTIFPEIAQMAGRICQDEQHPVWDRWREYLDQPKTDILAHPSSRTLIIQFYRSSVSSFIDAGYFVGVTGQSPLRAFHQYRTKLAVRPKGVTDTYLQSPQVHNQLYCFELLAESGILDFNARLSKTAQDLGKYTITMLLQDANACAKSDSLTHFMNPYYSHRVIRFLIRAGITISSFHLKAACSQGQFKTVKCYLDSLRGIKLREDIGHEVLKATLKGKSDWATKGDRLQVLQLLIDHGVKPDLSDCKEGIQHNQVEFVRLCIEKFECAVDENLIVFAIKKPLCKKMLDLLIQYSPLIQRHLRSACCLGDLNSVRLLVETYGIKPDHAFMEVLQEDLLTDEILDYLWAKL